MVTIWATFAMNQAGKAGINPQSWGHDARVDFVAFDHNYRSKIAVRKDRLRALQEDLYAKSQNGSSACSREVYVEAQWMTYYTCDYAAIDRQLDRLEQIAKHPGSAMDEKVQAADGSYAPCHNAWFYKLDRTCDRLTVMDDSQIRTQKPLAFLDRINSEATLLAYLNSVLISDIPRTGVNNAFELNIAGTDLLRLITRHLPSGYRFRPGLEKTILNWINDKWQDPVTGCFGPWYATNHGVDKAIDLSSTFHVADYSEGKIGRWPQLLSTLFAVKDDPWPHGWLQEGRLSNHHDFDVVSLLHMGWQFMTIQQRTEAKSEIRRMLAHCLTETLNADGSFKQEDMDTVGESYEFPVFLLCEAGYFHKSERFWTDETFPEGHALAKRIADRIVSQHIEDPESQTALYLLNTAD